MKRKKTIIIAVFMILSNVLGTYLFYYFSRFEHMDLLPARIYIYIYQAFSPVIFDMHTSIWGLLQPGIWDYCQLGLSTLILLLLIVFLTVRRWSGWLLCGLYFITAIIGFAHLLYFVYYGAEQPTFLFHGRNWNENIHRTAHTYIMLLWMLIISRIIWVSVSLILSWQIWSILKPQASDEI